jgi:hydrogenase expression/formation protein HypC
MCLAIPGKVIEIHQDADGVRMGKTNFGGIVKQVCLEYTPEVNCGDYILVHVGFGLSKVDEAEAQRTYEALEAMNQLTELDITSEISANRNATVGDEVTSPSAGE